LTSKLPILVVGATGLLGSEVVQLLAEAGHGIRVLLRPTTDPEKRRRLESFGNIEIVSGDLKDAGSLNAACRGVGAVVSTASAIPPRQPDDSIEKVDELGHLALLAAAERASVARFVFISFAPFAKDFALQRAKRKVEAALVASAIDHVILQPTFFTEFWLGPAIGFDLAGGHARVLGDGNQRVSWISFHDVARFAVAACERPGFSNAILQLGGPDALSALEVVKIFEELGAPAPQLDFVPTVALDAQLRPATNPVEEAFAALMYSAATGHVIDTRPQLELLDGRLTTVREYARASLERKKEK